MTKGDEKGPPPAAPAPANPPPLSPKESPHGDAVRQPSKELEDLRRRAKELEEERERLRRQNQELQDRHLRARADYENLAKRSAKEVQDTVRFVKSGLLLRVAGLVETVESMALDLERRGGAETKGVRLLVDEARKLLKDEGVREIPGKGLPFNYRFHQAVDRVETSTAAEGTVVEVVQRGYQFGDEILRPALVKVAVAPKPLVEPPPSDAKS